MNASRRASTGALVIVAIGIVPVIILTRMIARDARLGSRPGRIRLSDGRGRSPRSSSRRHRLAQTAVDVRPMVAARLGIEPDAILEPPRP